MAIKIVTTNLKEDFILNQVISNILQKEGADILPVTLIDDKQIEVIIVTLPEATPVYEASRLREDLIRAGINNKWWVVNQCLSMTDTQSPMLIARAEAENQWLQKVKEISTDNFVAIPWLQDASIQNIGNFINRR